MRYKLVFIDHKNQNMPRKKILGDRETQVLTASGRRCCLCTGLYDDYEVKQGQIAHLDHDPSNNSIENLAFLCLGHHDWYDSRPSQSKALTIGEVKLYRDKLYKSLEECRDHASGILIESAIQNISSPNANAASHGPTFMELLDLVEELTLTLDCDREYKELILLALAHNEPETAKKIANRLSLSSYRDEANWWIFERYLKSKDTEAALRLIDDFTLSSERDRARKLLLDRRKEETSSSSPFRGVVR